MDIEITKELSLNRDENCLLDMHSFLNIMNILIGELQLLGMEADESKEIEPLIGVAESLKLSMEASGITEEWSGRLHRLEKMLDAVLDLLAAKHPDLSTSVGAKESITNIRSVLAVLDLRVTEYQARRREPGKWIRHRIATLRSNFNNFFAAVERNSKGRYRIIYNIAAQEERDYVVSLSLESPDGEFLTMPAELQDVFRDLIANARKYTRPGGVITAGLREHNGLIRIVVEDNGMGIPADEIEKVVGFGYRATNARHLPTKGGGFGLTKAYLVTKALGGRFFMRSTVEVGTRIKIEIPCPAQDTLSTAGTTV